MEILDFCLLAELKKFVYAAEKTFFVEAVDIYTFYAKMKTPSNICVPFNRRNAQLLTS